MILTRTRTHEASVLPIRWVSVAGAKGAIREATEHVTLKPLCGEAATLHGG